MSVPPELMNAMPGADLSGLPAPAAPPKPAGMQPSRYAKPPMTAAAAASEMGAEGEKMLMSDLGQYRSDVGKVREASQEADAYEREHPPEMPASFQEQAPQYADFAKQVSPLLMIATVLGGKAMGVSAQGMLGAVTGMVQGTAEGNEQRYTEAYQNYQDHYKRFKEEEANRVAYRDKMLEWYKGRIDRPQLAAQASLHLINADEKIVNMGINGDKALSQLNKDLVTQNLQAARLNNQILARQNRLDERKSLLRDKEYSKVLGQAQSVEIAASNFQHAVDRVESSYKKLMEKGKQDPKLLEAIDLKSIFKSDIAGRVLRANYPEIAELEQAYGELTGPAIRVFNEGVTAAAQRAVRVEYAEMNALPDLSKGMNAVTAAIDGLGKKAQFAFNRANSMKSNAIRNYDETSNVYTSKSDLTAASGGAPAGGAPQGEQESVEQAASAAFGSYEPSKYEYRINPDTGKVQRKPR